MFLYSFIYIINHLFIHLPLIYLGQGQGESGLYPSMLCTRLTYTHLFTQELLALPIHLSLCFQKRLPAEPP